MWDNPRLLNLAAGVLVGLAALAFAAGGAYRLMRSEFFPVRHVELRTAVSHTTKEELEAALAGPVNANFFAVRLDEVRRHVEALPWVRRATVRRVWPDRLELELEEHVPLARWGGADESGDLPAMVNNHGERFHARHAGELPLFVAPSGAEAEVARRYARFTEAVAPLGSPIDRIVLTPSYAWQIRLKGGLHIVLGRDAEAAEARLRRFVEVHDATLKRIARRHEYVDLRYPNGFALRIPELKG